MGLYAIIKSTIVDGIAVSDAPLDTDGEWVCVDGISPQPGPGWTYENGVFSPPVVVPVVIPNIITKLATIERFTEDEYEGILLVAKSDVQVQGWLDRFAAATQINLDDSRTISGMDLLVSKNLLTQARANEILTAPVQPSERP